MMYYEPSLRISKLVVCRGDNVAYEQSFTSGINIIRGENSSGKSSVLNFIFYGLGGDFKGWTKEAALCDWVYLHLLINGEEELVVRRQVVDKKSQPMEIYFGAIDKDEQGAQILDSKLWKRFSFRRTEKSPSFSQILFQMLKLPEVRGEASSNITMHQLLRLIYAEQSNIPQKIFRFEQHDTPLIRDTVGSFLEGVYDDELYNLILEKNKKDKDFDVVDGQLKSFYKLFGASTGDLTVASLESQEKEWIEKAERLREEINNFSLSDELSDNEGREELDKVRDELKSVNIQSESLLRELRNLDFEIEDSREFIAELEERLRFLNESNDAAKVLKDIQFDHCPACFSELDKVEEGCCAICGKIDESNGASLLRMRNEITMQIKESNLLQEIRLEGRDKALSKVDSLKAKKIAIEEKYKSMISGWVSDRDLTLHNKYSDLGYALKAIEDVNEKKNMSGILVRLQGKKAELSAEISELDDNIEQREAYNEELKKKVHREIKKRLVYLLKQDLPRQDSFMSAEEIDFSYQENSIRVNGVDYFSASSMVFLNKCFKLAYFWSSGKLENMRYPRFLLLDGIEDGGIEAERAHNLQRLVKYVSEDMDVDHQVIMATSVLDEELDKPEYVRGEFYTHEKRTLAFP